MTATSIQWTDHSINPIRARNKTTGAIGHYCEKIAQGCAACYSSNFQRRFGLPSFGAGQHRDEVEIFIDDSKLDEVRRRKKPTRYFWCDMTDIFGDWMRPEWLAKCFATMDATPQHTHQLLTKRPENINDMTPVTSAEVMAENVRRCRHGNYRSNVWIGTSIATQADADKNIPALLRCRDLSPCLFVSAEPLIEAVAIRHFLGSKKDYFANVDSIECCGKTYPKVPTIDWVIAGGESGSHARPCDVQWIRSLRDQCRAAGVPVFVKQLGAHPIDLNLLDDDQRDNDPLDEIDLEEARIEMSDPKGGDWSEWPADLRVREFPPCQ